MRIMREEGIYNMSHKVSTKIGISEQKSFLCVAMRLGFLINHYLLKEKYTKFEAVQYIFDRLLRDLETTVRRKYKKLDEIFIKQAIETCQKKINVFQRAISHGLNNKD